MAAIKTVAVTVLAWVTVGSIAEAAPISWFSGSSNLSTWYANQSYANGGFYAPTQSPNAVLINTNWFNDPNYLASLGRVSSPTSYPASVNPTLVSPNTVPPQSAPTAYINFGTSPYANADSLTTGNPQSWTSSPAVVAAFGGTPNSGQQASFTQTVLADIQHTFQISGMNINLTTDPTAPAQHMMSVVSGASYPSNPNAIGITAVGSNGFGFIDKLAYANNPDQLAWAVAHNLSHELMHALGVASHPDTTGTYLDSATATWQMLTDSNAKFSPQAVQLMQSALGSSGLGSITGAELLSLAKHPQNCNCQFCQMMRAHGIDGAQLLEQPVPEPATVAIWSHLGGCGHGPGSSSEPSRGRLIDWPISITSPNPCPP